VILGGARSGKSSYAQELAGSLGKDVVFTATAESLDNEMAVRIENHKKSRPAHWQTIEAPTNIHLKLDAVLTGGEFVVIDCITLLVSNTWANPPIRHLQKTVCRRNKLTDRLYAEKELHIYHSIERGRAWHST
jgi:adenosylcobinamide kinase/adenosylcobinamide-phosphate guanylyltransferase